jgi:class 3 adenylate cyclase/tetratricopeptide (TPR) repeat protein
MSDVVCAHCGVANNAAQRFCGACGTALAEVCPGCGGENPGGFRFCGICGATLSEDPPPTLSEERRHASVLFADLSGFTDYSGRTDPEDVQQMVDRCMRRLGEVVEHFGASSTRVIGDQLMAVFGAPVAHEDDAERAVRAGLELQRTAEENRAEIGGLSLRVGINSGEVMFAPVGHDRSFTVIGDSVNVAARLQAAAPRGGVLVGQETVGATARAIRYRPLGPLTVKGKSEPVFAALALEPLAAPGEHPVSAAPMVGRDVELDLLRTTWERVWSHRRPHLVTVLGPAGIGKTRLYHEFAVEVTGRGQRVLHGRSLPYGENTGYGAFSQQLKELAGIAEADVAATARHKLAAFVGQLLPSAVAATTAAHLAQMTGLSGDGAADKGVLLLSARRFFESLAAERPTVVVFEDLHWGDASLLDLVESLATRCRDSPLLLLVLARPELLQRRPAWAVSSPHTALVLQDLSAAESVQLVQSLVRVADAGMVERLVERSGGNPLFLEELSASVTERLAETVADLPSGVKGTIAARLDALPPAERQLLLDASVIGKVFWTAALRRLGGGGDIASLLESLEARDIIRRERRTGIDGDEEFGFKHVLIQEVAYATLPRAARRERHAVVGRFLEDTTGDRGGQTASLLAYHWREANEAEKAVQYLLVAADGAGRAWAKQEAVALLDEAVSLIPETDAARRRTIRLRAAIMRLEGADHAAAAVELDDLLPDLSGREKVEALIARARVTHPLHDADGAILYGREAVTAAEAGGLDDLVGPALAVLSAGVNLAGEPADALAVGERALTVWPADQRTPDLALCLGVTGLQSYFLGRHEEAVAHGRRGYELARELYHGDQLLFTAGSVALGLAGSGRPEEALAFLEPVVALGLELGIILPFTARAVNILAGVLHDVHAFAEARERNEEGAELAGRAGFPIAVVQSGVDLLFTDLAEGEVGRAQAAWPALWEATQNLKGFHQWLVSGRLEAARAEILLRCGDHESAATEATQALASATRRGRRKYEVAARIILAEALMNLGRSADGIAQGRAALSVAELLGHPPTHWRAAATLSRLLASAGDEEGAHEAQAGMRHVVERFAAGLSEPRRAAFLNAPSLARVLELS